jgi:hypothetical protein
MPIDTAHRPFDSTDILRIRTVRFGDKVCFPNDDRIEMALSYGTQVLRADCKDLQERTMGHGVETTVVHLVLLCPTDRKRGVECAAITRNAWTW